MQLSFFHTHEFIIEAARVKIEKLIDKQYRLEKLKKASLNMNHRDENSPKDDENK